MTSELDVLRIVSDRLTTQGIPFMLTGSFALAYYATPRMTRDLDIVVALEERDIGGLVSAFEFDFYVDREVVGAAVRAKLLFNIMHLASGIKIDVIVKKATPYRELEFQRRKPIDLAGVRTWIVSREDLILSKLVWAQDSKSELQLRDVRALLNDTVDMQYLRHWAAELEVDALLDRVSHE
jgi:hypothetical protein